MWTYVQRTGALLRDGARKATGYSGALGPGRNNPEMQDRHDVGPIPAGHWRIADLIPQTATHGPYVLRLVPHADTNTFGRDGFLIHGDNARTHDASRGCIIVGRSTRELVWLSGDHELEVVAEEPAREVNVA